MERCSEQECKRWATIYLPVPFCDRHWAERFSTQYYEGVHIPFRKLFKDNLMKRGLWKKTDESRSNGTNDAKQQQENQSC